MNDKKPALGPRDVYENVKRLLSGEPRRHQSFRIFAQTVQQSNVVPHGALGIEPNRWDAASFDAITMFDNVERPNGRYWGDAFRRGAIASSTQRSVAEGQSLSFAARGVWPPRLENWRKIERSYVRAQIIYDRKVRALNTYKRKLFDDHLPMSDYLGVYVLTDVEEDWYVFDHLVMCEDDSISFSTASGSDIDITNPAIQIASADDAATYVRLKGLQEEARSRSAILSEVLKKWVFDTMVPHRNAGVCHYVYGDVISITIPGDRNLPTRAYVGVIGPEKYSVDWLVFWPWGRIAFVQG